MDTAHAQALRTLLEKQRIAALGTLQAGEPYVSMVPFALLPDGTAFVIHVSRLAAHTKAMLADSRVSLLVVQRQAPDMAPQELPRVTIQGDAVQLEDSAGAGADARAAYLSRFPESEMTFELADFSLFAIRPRSARFVGGFAQAKTFTSEGLARALAGKAE